MRLFLWFSNTVTGVTMSRAKHENGLDIPPNVHNFLARVSYFRFFPLLENVMWQIGLGVFLLLDAICFHNIIIISSNWFITEKERLFGDIWHFHTCYYKRQLGDNWSHDSKKYGIPHCVWKSQKKSDSTLRAKWATFTFWVSSLKMPKIFYLVIFWKPEACGQTVLPDRSFW